MFRKLLVNYEYADKFDIITVAVKSVKKKKSCVLHFTNLTLYWPFKIVALEGFH